MIRPLDFSTSSGIYCITQISTRLIYVGSGKNMRRRMHDHVGKLLSKRHNNPRLQNAWLKYGPDDFVANVLELVETGSMLEREQFWLDTLRPCDKVIGFNVHPNARSPLGRKRTPEQVERMRQVRIGTKATTETKAKLSAMRIGKKFSAAVRARASARFTPEMRAAQSAKQKGVLHSVEHKARISEGLRAYWQSRRETAV